MTMPPRNRSNNTSPPAQPTATKAPASWADIVGKHSDKLYALMIRGLKLGAVGLAVGTDEGRHAIGGTVAVVREYALRWWDMVLDGTSELGRRMRLRLMQLGALLLIGMLVSAFGHYVQWRAPILSIMAVGTFFLALNFAVQDVRWFVTTGMLKDGLQAIKPEAINDLLHFNPFTLIFGVAQPAVTGGLGLYWVYAQILMKIGFYGSLAYGYMALSFWHQPWLLSIVPVSIIVYVALGVAYTKETKGQLWFFWIFLMTALVAIVALLTVYPDFTGWISTAGVLVTTLAVIVVAGLVRYGVVWSSRQAYSHTNPGNTSSGRGSGLSGGQMGMLAMGTLQILAIVAIGAWAFGGCYRDSDGFRKVVGIAPALARSELSVYPIPPRGVDGVPGVTSGTIGTGSVSVSGEYESVTYPVRLNVDLGKLGSSVKATSGDRVRIDVSPSTRTYQAQGERSLQSIPVAGKFTDDGKHKLPGGQLLERFQNDYPMLDKAEGALIVQDGPKGERRYVGIGTEYTVPDPPRAREQLFYLNLPQRSELRGMLPPNQHIDLTITVTRRR